MTKETTSRETLEKVIEVGSTERRGAKPGTSPTRGPRTELVLITPETPGYKLVQMLFERGAERSKSMAEMADEIDVGLSTLSHLRTGRRLASQLDKDILKRMAEWLGIPPLAAMMLAEQVTLKDFYGPVGKLEEDIKRAIKYIRSDGDWGNLAPRGLDSWDDESKLYVIWCYEQATGTKLLGGGVNYADLLEQLRAFREDYPAEA